MTQPGKTLLYQDPVNRQHPLNAGLAAWWLHLPNRFGGGGLRLRDLLGRNHGTLSGMGQDAWRGPSGRKGGYGALAFDGSNDYVLLGSSASLEPGAGSFALEAWFRTSAAGVHQTLVRRDDALGTFGSPRTLVILRVDAANNRLRWYCQNNAAGGTDDVSSLAAVNDGEWHHALAVHGTRHRLYLDGVRQADAATTASALTSGISWAAGAFWNGSSASEAFSGLLDGLRFYRDPPASDEWAWRVYEDARRGHPGTLRWLPNRTWFVPAAGGQTVNLGLVSETDLSQAVSRLKTLAVGLNSETGLSQPVIPGREYGLGTTSETDLSQAASSAKESALGLNSETDLPQGVSPVRSYGLGPVSETDLSRAVGTMKSLLLGLNAETDTPQGVGTRKSLGTGSAAETDLAQTVTRYSPGTLGVVTETDLSLGVSSRKELGTGLVTETDTSLAASPVRAYGLGLGSETDGALSLGQTAKERGLGLAAETDAALGSTIPQEVEVGLVSSVHAALSVSPARRVTLGFVTEADGTFSLGFLKEKTVGLVAETDSAKAVTVIGGTLVVGPYYVDAVQVHRAGAVAVQAMRAGAVAVQAGVPT